MSRVCEMAPGKPGRESKGNREPVRHPDDDVAHRVTGREVHLSMGMGRHEMEATVAGSKGERAMKGDAE